MIYDTIIIGAGPAGITASIQLKRCGFKPLVLERNKIGGLIANANLIENCPGFPNGISGKNMVCLFQKQLKKHSIPVKILEVTGISRHEDIFDVKTGKERFSCRSLIIASGTMPKRLGCHGEECLAGKKVFYEIKEIPNLDKKKSVIIVGSGDIAFDYAASLAKRLKVKIIFRGRTPKCIPLLYKAVQKNPGIRIFSNAIIRKIISRQKQITPSPEHGDINVIRELPAGSGRSGGGATPSLAYCLKGNQKSTPARGGQAGEGVMVELNTGNKKWSLSSDYVLIAIGREPNLGFLPLTWQRTLKKDRRRLESMGVYIAGDADYHNLRYISIAAGDGLRAAMNIGRFLSCQ
jgi:thioredoxin reductase